MSDVCNVHQSEISKIDEVSTDVKWIKKFTAWGMTFIGSMLAVMVPLLASLFVYLSNVEKRVTLIEYKLEKHMMEEAKEPNHAVSVLEGRRRQVSR